MSDIVCMHSHFQHNGYLASFVFHLFSDSVPRWIWRIELTSKEMWIHFQETRVTCNSLSNHEDKRKRHDTKHKMAKESKNQ